MIRDIQINGIWYQLNVDEQEAIVIKSKDNEYAGDIRIESCFFYEGVTYRVTQIGDHAFEDCFKVRTITIPESILKTGYKSFMHLWGNPVVYLESLEAFCRIEFGFNGNPLQYAEHVFLNGKQLLNLIIPGTIKKIKPYTFYGCDFKSVIIEEGVTHIEEGAFCSCSLGSVTLPDSLEIIAASSFEDCTNLTSINIPDNVLSIGERAFSGCKELVSVSGGKNIKEIGKNAFDGCQNLEVLEIIENVEVIGESAFYDCRSIKAVIPPKLRRLGKRAFYGSWFDDLFIPESLTFIDKNAFDGCRLYERISVHRENPQYDSRGDCNAIIETATNTLIAGCETTVIPNNVTIIGENAFSGCSLLESITIPEGVTRIENEAFSGCRQLSLINIPDSIISIGKSAFNGCNLLSEVLITNLENWCKIDFEEEGNPLSTVRLFETTYLKLRGLRLSNLIIPETIASIKKYAFISCRVESIHIPKTISCIGMCAFSGCMYIKSLVIPKSVKEIGVGAFELCDSLEYVTILGNSRLSKDSFAGCGHLKDIYCYSDDLPEIDNPFGNLDLSLITLHVPSNAIHKYINDERWGAFGSIVSLKCT